MGDTTISSQKDGAGKKSTGKAKRSIAAIASETKGSRPPSSRRGMATIVEESEDDETDGEEFSDALDYATWIPGHSKASRQDVWKLISEFAETLRSGDHFHALTALWENTAEVMTGLDRGQIAPADAMLVVTEVIDNIRQRVNAGATGTASSSLSSDLQIMLENMAKDFGPSAMRSFLARIAAEMGTYVSGFVSAGMTVRDLLQIVRSDASLRSKFFSVFMLAISSLFTGSSTHAVALDYLRECTPDRFADMLGEIDSVGDPMRRVLSSQAALVLMAFLAISYPLALANSPQRRRPQNWGIRLAERATGWGSSLWSWYSWVRSLLTVPATAIPTATVQLSAGYEDEHGGVFEVAGGKVRDADPVLVTHWKERIGADQRLQSASDGQPFSEVEAATAFASRQARLTDPVTAVALPERRGAFCWRRPNPLLTPAASTGIGPYAGHALDRWDRKTEQLCVIYFELSETLPCVAKFEAIQGVRVGPPDRRTWERSCTLDVRDELLSAVRATKSDKPVRVKLSEEVKKLLAHGTKWFDASDATDAGRQSGADPAEGNAGGTTEPVAAFLQTPESPGGSVSGDRAGELETEVAAFKELLMDMNKSGSRTGSSDSSVIKEMNLLAGNAKQSHPSTSKPDENMGQAMEEYFSGAANEQITPLPVPSETFYFPPFQGSFAQDETLELESLTGGNREAPAATGSALPAKTLAVTTVMTLGLTWLVMNIKNALSSGTGRDALISEAVSLKVPKWENDSLLEIMLEAAGINLDDARHWPYARYLERLRRAIHIPLVNGESALQIVARAVGESVSEDELLLHFTEKLRVAPWGENAPQDTASSSTPGPDAAGAAEAAALVSGDDREEPRSRRRPRSAGNPTHAFFDSEQMKSKTLARLGETVSVLEFLQEKVSDMFLDPEAGKLDSTTSIRSKLGEDNFAATFSAITEKLGLVRLQSNSEFALDNMEFTTLRRVYDEVGILIDETKWLIRRLERDNSEDVSNFVTQLRHITNLRMIPPRPTARDSWNALTNGRNLYAVYDLYKSDAYKKLTSGYASALTNAQKTLELDLFGTSFADDMQKFVQKNFRIADMNSDDPVAQKFREWQTKMAGSYQQLLDQDMVNKFKNFYNEQAIKNDLSSPAKAEEFKMRMKGIFLRDNFQNLVDEIQKLPSHLVASTQVAKLKDNTEKKMKEMQAVRYIMSGPAFWSVPNRIAQAVYAETPVQRTLAVASTLEAIFGAFNVPNMMGWTVYDGLKSGEKFGKKFAATLTQGLNSATSSEAQNLKRVFSDTSRNGGLTVPKTTAIPKDVQKMISAQVKRDPTSLRTMADSAKTFRKQGPLWSQRIAGLFTASYSFANLQSGSSVQQAEGILRIVAASSFVGGTTLEIAFKGDFAAKIAKWANPVGIVANWGAGILNIVGIYQRGGPNRDRDIGLASAQLALEMATSIGAIAFPMVFGALSLFIPNFEAIGAAIDFHKMAQDLEKEGRTMEAMVARKMRDMSIADVIPIANWFSFAYRPLLTESMTIADDDILSQEATSYVAQLGAAWNRVAGNLPSEINDEPVYTSLVTPYRGTMGYYRRNPQIHAMHRTVYDTRNVTMWVVFHKDPRRRFNIVTDVAITDMKRGLTPTSPLPQRFESQRDYDQFTHQWQIQERKFDNRSMTTQDDDRYPQRPEYILVSTADASPGHTLWYRNSRSQRPGIYLVRDSVGKQLRLTAGAGNDTFVLDSLPQFLDGGAGHNVARFDVVPAQAVSLNMNQAKNIAVWHGAPTTRIVTGTRSGDVYVAAENNPEEVVNLGDGDDSVMAQIGSVNLGAGADRLFAFNIQRLADGGSGGGEEADFATYSEGKFTEFSLDREHVSAKDGAGTSRSGTLKNFEQLITTENADTVKLSSGTAIQALDLLGGDDTLELNGVSNIQAFTGEGNDQVTVNDGGTAYSNVVISTGPGDDTVTARLRYGSSQTANKDVRISTEEGNDIIRISKAPQSTRKDVMVNAGLGDDKIYLEGDVLLFAYFDNNDGVDHIYDHLDRTGPIVLLFGGDMRQADITHTLIKDDGEVTDAAGNQYAWVIRVRGERQGNLEINIHTFDVPEIYMATNADGKSWKADM